MTKNVNLYPSDTVAVAGTTYSDDFDVSQSEELMLVLAVTAQGAYTNETLDITIQGKDLEGNYFTLGQFTQVGNVVASVPYTEPLKLGNFGKQIRAKIVTAGTGVDYTLSVTGFGKRGSNS